MMDSDFVHSFENGTKIRFIYLYKLVFNSRYVELPDGRVQRVRYTVNKYSGFVAEITYEGQATTTPTPKYEPHPKYVPRPYYY